MTDARPTPRPALRRSRTDRVIAGVCGGLGVYLNVDPVLVRIGWAVLAVVTGGAALVAYVVAWLVMPEDGDDPGPANDRPGPEAGRLIAGGLLVVAGALWLFASLVPYWFRMSGFLALLVIAGGVVLIVQGTRR